MIHRRGGFALASIVLALYLAASDLSTSLAPTPQILR